MKILLKELIKNPVFLYLFGNFTLDLNETELALLGEPSSKTYKQAIFDWSKEKKEKITMTYKEHHNH